MQSLEHTTTVAASPARIWALYEDAENWPKWDTGVISAALDGQLVSGATGVIRPVGGPRVKFTIDKCEKERAYEAVSRLPLCRMRFFHEIRATGRESATITHRLAFEGPLAFFFRRVIGKGIFASMPEVMANFARLAEAG